MLCLLLLVGLTAVSGQKNPFQPLFSWKQVDWNFPNDSMRESYKTAGDFIPSSNVPLGVNVWQDKLFITVPRWKKGVPANLNYISLSDASANSEYSRNSIIRTSDIRLRLVFAEFLSSET